MLYLVLWPFGRERKGLRGDYEPHTSLLYTHSKRKNIDVSGFNFVVLSKIFHPSRESDWEGGGNAANLVLSYSKLCVDLVLLFLCFGNYRKFPFNSNVNCHILSFDHHSPVTGLAYDRKWNNSKMLDTYLGDINFCSPVKPIFFF